MNKLSETLNREYYDKLIELHKQKTASTHNKSLTKQAKKFCALIVEFNLPYLSPYAQFQSFNINTSTISGPLKYTTPSIKHEDTKPTVINISNITLDPNETEFLSLGLKFCPTDLRPNTAAIASSIEPTTRSFGPAVEHAIANDIATILQQPSRPTNNLKPHLSKALKTLRQKKNKLKITRADKGNATVVMTQDQYKDKMMDHLNLDCYDTLKKDPTDSLTRKLDTILKKLLKEHKIDKSFYQSCRTSNPRKPQLYGLPKIHKPRNPIRPIVSFYCAPLSSFHKQFSIILKPLTISPLRLKDSLDFVNHLRTDTDPDFSYFCSLDVKSLYTNCDMRQAAKLALDKFRTNPSLLPDNRTIDAIHTLIHFSLDNSYFEFDNTFYKQVTGGPMGSPLTVALAEIRVTDNEYLAMSSFPYPPKHYKHFVDDGFGHFADRTHAHKFLQQINSLTEDLQYTIEYPSDDGSIPFLDGLIHPDRSTSIYRKPTHTNLYAHYSSSSPASTKNSIISSLTLRAYKFCSLLTSTTNYYSWNTPSSQMATSLTRSI